MKKFGFLFALIAVLAMGTSAFAAAEVASVDIRLVLSDDSGTWDTGKGFKLISNDKVLQILSTDQLGSYDVSFTMYAGQKASLSAYVASDDKVYKDAEFERAAVAGFLSCDNSGPGVKKITLVMSPDVSVFADTSVTGSMDIHVSGDIFNSLSNVISPDVKFTVTFKKPVAQPTVGAVSFSKNDDKGLASKDVSVTWVVNDDATAGQFASESTEIKDIKVAVNGVVSTDIANGVSIIAGAERAKLRIVISMDKVVSDDVISYDAKAVISGDNGDGVIREYSAPINGKFVITSSDKPGPGPVPVPDPVKPEPGKVNPALIPDGNTTLEAPAIVSVPSSTDVKAAIKTDEGKALLANDGTLNANSVTTELKKMKYSVSTALAPVTPEPFSCEVTAGKVAIVQVDVKGKFNDLSKVKFVKLKADGKLEVSGKWAKKIGDLGDKGFTFLKADGLTLAEKSADVQFLVIAVKDNGDFDLNTAAKKVMDPAMFAEITEEHKSSSSGCSAGYAPFALLLAAPLFLFRKRG